MQMFFTPHRPVRWLNFPLVASLSLGMTVSAVQAQTATLEPVWVRSPRLDASAAQMPGFAVRTSRMATKTETQLQEIAQSVSVVPRQQLQDQQPRTASEALRYTPGVMAAAAGATTRFDLIALRGFTDRIAANTYLDGLRLLADPDGFNALQLDPYALERIDVMRGPASVTYGQGAPGGLVGLTSKRPQSTPQREIEVSVGNRAQRSLGLDITGPVAGRSDMQFRWISKAAAADQQQRHAHTERFMLAPSLDWKIQPRTRVLFQAYVQNDPHTGYIGALPYAGTVVPRRGSTISTAFNEANPDDGMQRQQRHVGWQLEHAFGDHLKFQQHYRYQRSRIGLHQHIALGWAGGSDRLNRYLLRIQERTSAHTLDNQLQARFTTGPAVHQVLLGLDYQRGTNEGARASQFTGTTIDPFQPIYTDAPWLQALKPQQAQRTQRGVYLQDQISWKQWHFTAGVRHDAAQVRSQLASGLATEWEGDRVTKRLGVVYAADSGVSAYASYSDGFDPSKADAVGAQGQQLQPSQSRQWELGLRYLPESADLQLSAAVFDLRQKEVASFNYQTLAHESIGQVRTQGVELEAKARISPRWDLLASYTYNAMRVRAGALRGQTPFMAPAHQAAVWSSHKVGQGMTVGLGVRYTGTQWADLPNTAQVGAVRFVDAMLRYDLVHWSPALRGTQLQLNVQNLLDKQAVTSCYSATLCSYGLRRTVLATLQHRW